MKKLLILPLLLSCNVALLSNPANAQQGRTPKVISPGFGMPILAAGGPVNVTTAQITPLINKYMDQYFNRQQEDKEFFENSLKDINNDYKALFQNVVVNYCFKKSSLSQTGQFIDYKEFLDEVAQYQSQRQALETKILALQSITSGALPSAGQVLVTEGKTASIPAYRSINMQPIIDNYHAYIKKDIEDQINGMTFVIKDALGSTQTVKGFNVDFSKLSSFDANQRKAMLAKINENRHIDESLKIEQNKFTMDWVKGSTEVFIRNFGENERYRFRNGADYGARGDAFSRLSDILWMHSYMRLSTGMPQGAVGITYTKRFANIEEFLNNPYSYWQFHNVPVRNTNDLENVLESFRNNVESADERSASVFDGKFGILARFNSLLTSARGYGPMMEAAALTLRALAADAKEEMMIQSQPLETFQAAYKSRYYTNKDAKAHVLSLMCTYDSDTYGDKCDSIPHSMSDGNNDGTPGGDFKKLITNSTQATFKFGIARNLAAQLKILDAGNAGFTAIQNETKKRLSDDLFN